MRIDRNEEPLRGSPEDAGVGNRTGFRAATALGVVGVVYAFVTGVGMIRAGPTEPIVDPVPAVAISLETVEPARARPGSGGGFARPSVPGPRRPRWDV